MLATIKLDDEEELDKLVNELYIPFIDLKYVEFDISFSFDVERLVIFCTRNYLLINLEDCSISLTIEDEKIISDWISNYKNIEKILFKLWSD
jgi:hypothetical protein